MFQVSRGKKAHIICDNKYHDQPEKIFDEFEKIAVEHVEAVVLQDCPQPPVSWSAVLTKMGVRQLRKLQINGGEFECSLLGNLTGLKMLEIKYLKKLHLTDTEQGLPPSLISIEIRNIKNLTSNSSPLGHLKNLKRIYIDNCNVQLSRDFFSGISSLENVSLGNIDIKNIPEGLFDGLWQLKSLNLKKNKIKTLAENIFHNNILLESINLSDNPLETIPEGVFRNLVNIKEFSMVNKKHVSQYKKLTLPTEFLPPSIEKLQFVSVNIQNLPTTLLKNCPKLKFLRIQKGKLTEIPDSLFSHSRHIEFIDFAGNEIRTLSPNMLRNLRQLKTLRLHFNKLEEINENILINSTNIEHIELQNNMIRSLDDGLLLKLPYLQNLTLSNNHLQVIPYQSRNITSRHRPSLRLERLFLAGNKIQQVNIAALLSGFSKIKTLDLEHNQLTGYLNLTAIDQINSTSLELNLNSNKLNGLILDVNLDKKLKVSLKNNPLKCDCFATVIKEQEYYSNLQIIPNNIDCEGDGVALVSKSTDDLLCPAALVDEDCEAGCRCEVNTQVRHAVITCDIRTRKHLLEALRSYQNWTVDLRVTSVPGPRIRVDLGGHNIRELHLSNIELEEVHLESIPSTLHVIRLDNNKLKSVPHTVRLIQQQVMAGRREDFEVRLGENPWMCHCDNVELLLFVQKYYSVIKDKVTFDCDNLRGQDVRQLEISDLCHENIIVFHIIGVLIPIICILLIIVISGCYRDLIFVYVFSKPWGKYLISEESVDRDKSHDVFISYSHADSPWVESVLLPGLERPVDDRSAHYKCLVHTRDWLPGQAIPDQILESVESSRRTVIVLSRDFVTSVWSNMEFRAAHSKAIKENIQVYF